MGRFKKKVSSRVNRTRKNPIVDKKRLILDNLNENIME